MAWLDGIALYFFDMGWWLKATAVQINISRISFITQWI